MREIRCIEVSTNTFHEHDHDGFGCLKCDRSTCTPDADESIKLLQILWTDCRRRKKRGEVTRALTRDFKETIQERARHDAACVKPLKEAVAGFDGALKGGVKSLSFVNLFLRTLRRSHRLCV
jgi:hypothetical protein